MNIYFFHLWNNYSGSTIVLSQVIERINSAKIFKRVEIVTSKGLGPLNQSCANQRLLYTYNGTSEKLRWLSFIYATTMQLLFILFCTKKDDVLYLNTNLFAPIVKLIRIFRPNIIWHLHEDIAKDSWINKVLRTIDLSMVSVISVSQYASQALQDINVEIIPNFFETSFVMTPSEKKGVLFVGSTAQYKGFETYVELARSMPEVNFFAALSSEPGGVILPKNLDIYIQPNDLSVLYNMSYVTLNLTNPDLVRETFGMTMLEAIRRGNAVVYPSVGGIAESFNNYKYAYPCSDPRDIFELKSILKTVALLDNNSIAFEARKFLLKVEGLKPKERLLALVKEVKKQNA